MYQPYGDRDTNVWLARLFFDPRPSLTMDPDAFSERLRRGERWSQLSAPADTWLVVRLDGRGFSRLSEAHFEKPFDPRMNELMTLTAADVFEEFRAEVAVTQSDEISLALPPNWNEFSRRIEKVLSLMAALASASFTHSSGIPTMFDARIWVADAPGPAGVESVIDYFRWRQADGARCALNTACYWGLRKAGASASVAGARLDAMDHESKLEWLAQAGQRLEDHATWTRNGVGLCWEAVEAVGQDPRGGKLRTAERRKLAIERELPFGAAFGTWVAERLG